MDTLGFTGRAIIHHRSLFYYRERGILSQDNLVLIDYYIGDQADLYLALKYVDGHEHETSHFERFDICPNSVEKLNCICSPALDNLQEPMR